MSQASAHGKETHFGRDAMNVIHANTPGQSLWYAKLAMNRMFWDQVAKEVDPEHDERFKRVEAKAQADMQQHYWWHPGQALPARAPDPNAVLGGSTK